MRKIILALFLIMLTFPCFCQKEKKEELGKVFGQIVDPDTGMPVNEPFYLYFYDPLKIESGGKFYRTETDNKGSFEKDVIPLHYKVVAIPVVPDSKYAKAEYDMLAVNDNDITNQFKFDVNVEKGKITKFKQSAVNGVSIEILIVNERGLKILASDLGDKIKLECELVNKDYKGVRYSKNLNYSENEVKLYGIIAGEYSVRIYINGTALTVYYNDKYNICISGKLSIQVNMNNIFVLSGKVTDIKGNALKNAFVNFVPIKHNYNEYVGGGVNTNSNGDYRIIGLKRGLHDISITYFEGGVEYYKVNEEVDIVGDGNCIMNFTIGEK